MSQLFLFSEDATIEGDSAPIYRRRTLSEADRASNLRRLQADFDTRAKQLQRCEECRGYVQEVDSKGRCPECVGNS